MAPFLGKMRPIYANVHAGIALFYKTMLFRSPSEPLSGHRHQLLVLQHLALREGPVGLIPPCIEQSSSIHVCGVLVETKSRRTLIFTYIYHENQPNVGTYTKNMDGKGDVRTCAKKHSRIVSELW